MENSKIVSDITKYIRVWLFWKIARIFKFERDAVRLQKEK